MKRLNILTIALALCLSSCGDSSLEIDTPSGTLTLTPLADNAVRVRLSGDLETPRLEELIYTEKVKAPSASVKKTSTGAELILPGISVRYDRDTDLLTFTDADGRTILQESSRSIRESEVRGTPCYEVSQTFACADDESIFGTGQFQDGYLDIKGLTRRLTQVNTQISIPYILSSKGYAILWNNYGLTEFNPADNCVVLEEDSREDTGITVNATGTSGNRRETRFYSSFAGRITVPEKGKYAVLLDVGQKMARRQYLAIDGNAAIDISNLWLPPTGSAIVELEAGVHDISVTGSRGDSPKVSWRKVDNTTTFRSPVAGAIDYTVFAGNADECTASYRRLTGQVPAMAEWMFGYIHCRERYTSSDDILENAAGFKDRGIPLDVIVQDWQWWGKYGWNALRFDEDHYPDPRALTDSLHRDSVRLMLSVWSKVDRSSNVGMALDSKGYYIPETDWVDFFNPEAADYYCRNFLDSLGRFGIDAWWFDATEPENDDLAGRMVGRDPLPGEFYRNVYPLMVNRVMYGGLKSISADEPVILTRNAFAGIQRYGVVTWSGDVGNDFGTLRRQIAGGLGQMACGLPWWTFDAGGFFRPADQYTDEAYQERMIRWLQVATFLPFMRVHGYMSMTEPWRYGDRTLEIFRKYIDIREQLRPYITECAARVSDEGYTMMRPLVFDFADDREALRQDSEYMFGPDYLVCPVLQAGVSTWTVYLPENEAGWENWWTGETLEGGRYVEVPADLETIPVFKRKRI